MSEAIDMIRASCANPGDVTVLCIEENGRVIGKRPALETGWWECSAEGLDAVNQQYAFYASRKTR